MTGQKWLKNEIAESFRKNISTQGARRLALSLANIISGKTGILTKLFKTFRATKNVLKDSANLFRIFSDFLTGVLHFLYYST